ncbi:MAG: BMP family ABC transporter substrate-binding protein [Erysipelotrichaceae bacterium]|nr:BMP family ABC transporter substrate-binding protein [Erysipelotrichaceae bacterium]
MKKLICILLACFMVFGLVACNSGTTPAPSAEPTQETEKTEPAPAEDKIKIAYCINGTKGDKSFFDSGTEGMDWINRDFGDKAEAVEFEFTYDDTTWKSQLENVFMSEEYDIIIVGTYDMLEMTVELTAEYPDQKVWFYDEQWDFETNPRDNVISLLFKQNEGSYVVGYMAAMASKTNHISFCGGMSNTVLQDFFAGYQQGAKAYNPDIVVDETWMDSFSDSSKGKDVASASYSQGVDVVFACGGSAGLGVFEAALEYPDVYVIGVDGDQGAMWEAAGETAKAEKTITSMTKNVNQGFYDTFKKELDGTLEYGQNYRLGVNGGYVGAAITSTTENVFTPEQLQAVKDVQAGIADGSIVVDTAF